jgi:putative FmdB family regulatory protein
MPIYEYTCGGCGHHFEVLVRNARDLPSKCPKCATRKLQKAFSRFAVSAGAARGGHACDTCPAADAGCACDHGTCSVD